MQRRTSNIRPQRRVGHDRIPRIAYRVSNSYLLANGSQKLKAASWEGRAVIAMKDQVVLACWLFSKYRSPHRTTRVCDGPVHLDNGTKLFLVVPFPYPGRRNPPLTSFDHWKSILQQRSHFAYQSKNQMPGLPSDGIVSTTSDSTAPNKSIRIRWKKSNNRRKRRTPNHVETVLLNSMLIQGTNTSLS